MTIEEVRKTVENMDNQMNTCNKKYPCVVCSMQPPGGCKKIKLVDKESFEYNNISIK